MEIRHYNLRNYFQLSLPINKYMIICQINAVLKISIKISEIFGEGRNEIPDLSLLITAIKSEIIIDIVF